MENGFYLITGTSRGIGETLAQALLEQGQTVLGVARSQSNKLTSSNYHHIRFDLSNTTEIDQLVDQAAAIVNRHEFDFLCLVNNASLLEPLKSIEACNSQEIDAHIRVGLIAPMVLTSAFMRAFAGLDVRKKIVFITSGAGSNPMQGASVYSTAKAGIDMFTRAVGVEQQDRENGFEVIAISPGMVETTMQKITRSKSTDEFASAERFRQAKQNGYVQEPDNVAGKILSMIDNKYDNGAIVHV